MEILVFGGTGLVGSEFISQNTEHFKINAPTSRELNILDFRQLEASIRDSSAEVVVNFVAYTNLAAAETEKGNKEGLVYQLNAVAVSNLVTLCGYFGKHLVHVSTDYVFGGGKQDYPYSEEDRPDPINWYGQTKYQGERFIDHSHTIARISMPYRASFASRNDVARTFLDLLERGKEINAVADQTITPGFIPDISNALRVLIENRSEGIFHLAPTTWTTPFKFAKAVAKKFGFDQSLVKAVSLADFEKNRPYKMPRYCWLDTGKFQQTFGEGILHDVSESLDLFKKQFDLVG